MRCGGVLMGDNTREDQISLLFGVGNQPKSQNQEMNPFSTSSPSCYYHHPLEMDNGEDSGGGGECLQEDLDVPEEPLNPGPHRSGSKRSRAAEVHNMSEKRRRSRINEKMKALQNLIPNSNKTDKASMLDEAIEYLKQLQLQVQMLSMRNGLNSHPMYLPGSLHPLQASQLCMAFGDSAPAMNMSALGMLTLNQDSSMNNSFDLTSQCTTSHLVMPTTTISAPEPSFCLDPLKSHHASFQLRVPAEEMFKEDMISQQQLDSGRTTGNLSENVMKTIEVASLNFGGQGSSSLERSDHHPEDDPIFTQNFDGLQRSKSFTEDDASQKL